MATTFAEVVRSRAGDDAVGLRFGDEAWTWAEVVQEAADRAAASAAVAARVPRGGRPLHVGLLLENVPDFVFWTLAAGLGGFVVVGINPTRRGEGLARDVRHTDVDLLVTEDRQADLLDGLDLGLPDERIVNVDRSDHATLLAVHRDAPLPDTLPEPDRALLLLFSSGSTGAPKAVICSQDRLGRLSSVLAERTGLRRDSVTYLCMPLFHGNSMMMNLAPALHVGAEVVLARRFSASRFGPDIHRYGVTFVNYVGRALHYVLARPAAPEDPDSTLEAAYGTEASEADQRDFAARFGCEVVEGYGSTEGVVRINRTDATPQGALGVAVGPFEVLVLDEETEQECPPAEFDDHGRMLNPGAAIGQIVARGGASAFEGYYANPDAQAERVHGEDFWTGDLAYRDADGFFHFAGRSSDWLRVDGENFAAAPVQRILARWDPVLLAVVYAVPDPATGDQVMAALHLDEGAIFDPEAFVAFLDAQADLGTKWRPRFVRLLDDVPLTASGKVAASELRGQAWSGEDEVWWRPDPREPGYAPFDAAARSAWEAVFAAHGRRLLLPAWHGSGAVPVSGTARRPAPEPS